MTFSLEEAIIVMFFISCLDSHSDGTHSLQKIHWRGSDVNVFSEYVQMKKQTYLYFRWPKSVYILILELTFLLSIFFFFFGLNTFTISDIK